MWFSRTNRCQLAASSFREIGNLQIGASEGFIRGIVQGAGQGPGPARRHTKRLTNAGIPYESHPPIGARSGHGSGAGTDRPHITHTARVASADEYTHLSCRPPRAPFPLRWGAYREECVRDSGIGLVVNEISMVWRDLPPRPPARG